MNFALIIPSCNACSNGDETWRQILQQINAQTCTPFRKLLVDTSSSDNTVEIAKAAGFEVITIAKADFNHGATRNQALKVISSECEAAIFMCQDALLSSTDAFATILATLKDNPKVAAAYGRQLPDESIYDLENFTRNFNYPAQSQIRSMNDVPKLGLRAIFFSDTFAIYRLNALDEIGGIPNSNFGEDTLCAAKFLLNGYQIAYESQAAIYHHHHRNLSEEFERGRAIGRMHRQERELLVKFGSAESEGSKLLGKLSFRYWRVVPALAVKYLGFIIGRNFGK